MEEEGNRCSERQGSVFERSQLLVTLTAGTWTGVEDAARDGTLKDIYKANRGSVRPGQTGDGAADGGGRSADSLGVKLTPGPPQQTSA